MNNNAKVCIGFNNIVGVGTTLKNGFIELGHSAEFYSNEKSIHKFDYSENISYQKIRIPRKKPFNYVYAFIKVLILALKFDYFIIVQLNGSLLNHYRDIRVLRFFRKKTMLILAGCDARIPNRVEEFTWNPCKDCSDEYKKFVQCDIGAKKEKLKLAESLFTVIASPEECAGYLSRPYKPFRFPIRTAAFSPVYPEVENKIIILHAPSHHHVKGTRYIQESVQKLTLKYPNIEFVCIQNAPKSDVLFYLKSAHIVIDQMLVGFYGMFAVEAMALGKPVICYIRPDIWLDIQDDCPIINANPDNLYSCLAGLIEKKEILSEIGRESRKYVENNHDVSVVSRNILAWFNENVVAP
jgi:glycosyltransferase involved in cell wall biosynthesis